MSRGRVVVMGVLLYRKLAPAGILESIFLLKSNLLYFTGEFTSANFKLVNSCHTLRN